MKQNPDRAAIERALTHHAAGGRIRSWTTIQRHPGGPVEWQIVLNPGVHTDGDHCGIGPDGIITTGKIRDGKLICAVLASADLGQQGYTAKQVRAAIDHAVGALGCEKEDEIADLAMECLADSGRPETEVLPGWTAVDLEALLVTAGELWNSSGGQDPYDVLSSVQKVRLDAAAGFYRDRMAAAGKDS
jgi:hypothetical protein